MYWAEGSKRELVFTNTDKDMLRLYIYFLEKVFALKKVDIFVLIRISDPIKPSEAIEFWRSNLHIGVDNIKIDHNNLQNKTKKQYGICRITIKKGGYKLKVIKCMIERLHRDFLGPCSSMDRTLHS